MRTSILLRGDCCIHWLFALCHIIHTVLYYSDNRHMVYMYPRSCLSLLHARFTLADPMPRLCPDAVGSANMNGLQTRNRLSGPHQEAIGKSSGNIKHV